MKATIEGTVRFIRSDHSECCCCDGPHICSKTVDFDNWDSPTPAHFPRDANRFVLDNVTAPEFEGRRVRLTIEVLPMRTQADVKDDFVDRILLKLRDLFPQ
jgi:hypothetical protein